jgi:aminoglycoside 3'-phosphotransferase II
VADRYQDLALAARSLEYNLGRKWVDLLFEEYGISLKEVDWVKIEFYQLLDEFF